MKDSSRRVYSFDVFDTALTRTIYPPGNVWLEVGRRLATGAQLDEAELEAFAHTFAAQRLAAEKDALVRGGREDVELRDVYRHFEWLDAAEISASDAMRMELAVERELVVPISETLAEVARLQRLGERVVFISDTYLSKYTVLRLLRTTGYKIEPDQVYVSATVGWTKYSGNLFLHVLNKEGISRHQLHHSGDNPHSDVLAAARVGLASEWFRHSLSTRYEQSFGRYLATDPSVTAHSVGLLRAARMSENDSSVGPVTAAGVIAPMATCFASWVLQQAQRHGADLILFIARDGEVIYEAASALAEPDTPPLSVFETSRRSVFSSFLDAADLQTFSELLREPERIPLREILRRFFLEPNEIAAAEEFASGRLDETRPMWEAAEVRELLERAGLLALVLARSADAKKAFRVYCEQRGLFRSRKPLFVDVGWAGSYEKIIERIFTAFGIESDWRLAYFALSYQPTKKRALYGRCIAYANRLGSHSHECETSWDYTRHVEVIEAVCTPSPRGPVISYGLTADRAQAVRRELDPGSGEVKYAAALHKHVAKFAARFKAKQLHHVPAEMFRAAVLRNLATFLQEPRSGEVSHIVGFNYLSGFDNSEAAAQPVAMSISTGDALRLLLGRAFRRRMPAPELRRRFELAKMTWPEAARLLTPGWARAIKRRVPTRESTKWWLRRMVVERNRGPFRFAMRGFEYYKRTPRPDVTAAVPARPQRNGKSAELPGEHRAH